jgi:hypothetical protein
MNLSPSKASESHVVVWVAWFLAPWMAVETGALFLGVSLFHIPVHRLIGPYVALAVAPAVAGPLFYRINRRRADPPKRRARSMAIAATMFSVLFIAALCYSAVDLGLASANLAIATGIVMLLFCMTLGYFVAYRAALAKATLSARQ